MATRRGPNPRFFDLWSRFYDASLVQRITYRPVQDAVLRRLRAAPPGRLLDVGCGTGLLTSRIRSERPTADVVGCDFSHGMLRRAARNSPGIPWVRGDALRLPFRGEGFDAVVCTEAFHWFPDQEAALAEFFRVLAPKGRLLVALVNPPAEWLSRATRAGSHLVGEPLWWPTRAQLRAQVEAVGFQVKAQQVVFRLPAPLILPCVLTVAERPG
jgi:ubiquinone/menaquinone biosynthesis C-methylase UbiE